MIDPSMRHLPALAGAVTVLAGGMAARIRLVATRVPAARSSSATAAWPGPARQHTMSMVVRWLTLRWRSHRLPSPTDDELAAWCDELSRRLRTGSSLTIAICSAPRTPAVDTAIAPVVLGLQRGDTLAGALGHAGRGSPPLAIVLSVLQACALLGGHSAAAIDRVAATLRRRSVDAAERRVHSAQARMSALVLTVLPGGVLAVTALTSGTARATITTSFGLLSVGTGCLLNAVGWWWMRRIIEGAP
jgi:Flp pilus assembly protein TadB